MTWRVRRMSLSDIDHVYAIETSAHITPWSKSILQDCILVGYHCLVLERQILNQWVVSGYMICRQKDGGCHLLNFCIAKSIQSQGYGRKFLQYLLNALNQDDDVDYVFLEVRPSNKIALHLYESLDFKQTQIKRNYYQDNEHKEDAIVLKKIIRS